MVTMVSTMFKRRYERNRIFSPAEQELLAEKKVAVIGCGGLGGHLIEMMGRLGVGSIVAVDGDVFDETNLNRQLLCNENNIGSSKAIAPGCICAWLIVRWMCFLSVRI